MKRHFLLLLALAASAFSTTLNTALTTMAARTTITRIDPTDWFVGLHNTKLQLMAYGPGIGLTKTVTTDYSGVTVDSIVRLDSPNYLLVYLDLKGAEAGTMTLRFDKTRVNYTLRSRTKASAQRIGFDASDVLYLLMPDRFAQGTPEPINPKGMRQYVVDRSKPSLRHGGNLEGIRRHLDYFSDLGVTALWFTPVLENDSPDTPNGFSTYHGYATTDYYRVDPRFGTNEEYRQLISEAHAKGLKVVMDMIFNHCGLEHPWAQDIPQHDWFNAIPAEVDTDKAIQSPFGNVDGRGGCLTSYKLTPVLDPYASEIDLRETTEGWFVTSMPDLNQRNPHLMRYLIQNSIWWIETADIDGIRMDTYPYAFRDGMTQWMKELDEEYPNFNTVGETWVTEPAYTAAWQDCGDGREGLAGRTYLKTVMDFAFFDRLNSAKSEETDAWWNGLNRLYNSFCYDYLYPDPSHVLAFIENHDTDRFLGNGRDTLMLRQALALLLTCKRIPQLYYGTEVLMGGTKEVTDGLVRCDFPGGFPGDSHDCFSAEGRTHAEQGMFRWMQRVLKWRRGNDVISRGTQKQFIPYEGIYVVCRQLDGRTVLTVLNGTTASATFHPDRYAEVIGTAKRARDITTGRYFPLDTPQTLRPRQSLILEF